MTRYQPTRNKLMKQQSSPSNARFYSKLQATKAVLSKFGYESKKDKIVSAIRSKVYGKFFSHENPVSTQWGYLKILSKLENDSTLLDIGCGDGIYFTNEQVVEMIRHKNLKIRAIDVDAGAVEICQQRLIRAGLEDFVFAECVSVEDIRPATLEEKYDYAVWMESFPVIEIGLFSRLFQHSMTIVKKKCFMYHNLLKEYSVAMHVMKPLINYCTMVDFGRATTVDEMKILLQGMTHHKFTIKPLLWCKRHEMMSPILSRFEWFLPKSLNAQVTQYLIEMDVNNVSIFHKEIINRHGGSHHERDRKDGVFVADCITPSKAQS